MTNDIQLITKTVCTLMLAFACVCCGGAAATGDSTTSESQATTESASGAITDFSLKDVDGKTHSLSDFLGEKVIVISFWATWCEPCKKEMVQLQSLYDKHKDNGLQVISISMDEPETQSLVRPYIKQRGYSILVLKDTEMTVTNQLNPRRAAPFTLIIDKNQNVVWEHESYVPGDEVKLEAAILEALGVSGS